MRVAIIAVGKRTEHWEGLFRALVCQPDLELFVQVADVSHVAEERLGRLAEEHPRFGLRLSPHVLGEEATGHMASIAFRPHALRQLRDFAPDVLHVIGEPSYLATFQAIRARNRLWPRVPITHYAAQNVVTRFPWPFPLLERYAYRHIDMAFPITPAALEVLRTKGYRGEAETVPLGVDRAEFAPRGAAPEGPFTVGFVGRLEDHKGIADLMAARERIGCRLLLVGDGSLRPWVEDQARLRPGLIELVPWADHSELPRVMARMHALALPSVEIVQRNVVPWMKVPLREQFGRVLVEAMSCGVPVVASDVGEIAHVVGSGGVIVRPRDPAALAEALAHLRDSPGAADRLARLALARAARFDWTLIADQLTGCWGRVVLRAANRQPGHPLDGLRPVGVR
jgi:glycosyltransferase involved in cell wall biosynthesis